MLVCQSVLMGLQMIYLQIKKNCSDMTMGESTKRKQEKKYSQKKDLLMLYAQHCTCWE